MKDLEGSAGSPPNLGSFAAERQSHMGDGQSWASRMFSLPPHRQGGSRCMQVGS